MVRVELTNSCLRSKRPSARASSACIREPLAGVEPATSPVPGVRSSN